MKNFLIFLTAFATVFLSAQTSPTVRFNSIGDMVAYTIPGVNSKLSAIVSGGISATGDSFLAGEFAYSADSTATTNQYSIFKPIGTTGRWIRITGATWNQTPNITNPTQEPSYAFQMTRGVGTNALHMGVSSTNVIIQTFSTLPLFINPVGANNVILNELGGKVGIGTAAPGKALEINSATGANLRLTHNDSDGSAAVKADFDTNASGYLTINPSGAVLAVNVTLANLSGLNVFQAYATTTYSAEGSYAAAFVSDASRTKRVVIGYDNAINAGVISAVSTGIGWQSLSINPNGGLVGIGTTAAGKALEINSATGANLRLTYNDSDGSAVNYADLSMSSGGNLTIAPSGGALSVTGSISASTYTSGSVQSLTGAGAVNVTTAITEVTTTGAAQALTLADGVAGQQKTIIHGVDGGSFVLTPTTKTGWSTFTATAAGESITLVFLMTRGWIVKGSYLGTIAP